MPKTSIYYAGCKVLKIIPTPTQAIINNFILIMTYNNEFSISFASDTNIKASILELKKMIEEDIDILLKKLE